jgi:homoserine dehydrogenase
LFVADRPGVLAAIAGVLGRHSVSVRSMEQDAPEPAEDLQHDGSDEVAQHGEARLVFVTHVAYERDVQACLHDLHKLDAVRRIGGLVRVVGQ